MVSPHGFIKAALVGSFCSLDRGLHKQLHSLVCGHTDYLTFTKVVPKQAHPPFGKPVHAHVPRPSCCCS
jgi:hypothetical protein